jgi:hypothetical protein
MLGSSQSMSIEPPQRLGSDIYLRAFCGGIGGASTLLPHGVRISVRDLHALGARSFSHLILEPESTSSGGNNHFKIGAVVCFAIPEPTLPAGEVGRILLCPEFYSIDVRSVRSYKSTHGFWTTSMFLMNLSCKCEQLLVQNCN